MSGLDGGDLGWLVGFVWCWRGWAACGLGPTNYRSVDRYVQPVATATESRMGSPWRADSVSSVVGRKGSKRAEKGCTCMGYYLVQNRCGCAECSGSERMDQYHAVFSPKINKRQAAGCSAESLDDAAAGRTRLRPTERRRMTAVRRLRDGVGVDTE